MVHAQTIHTIHIYVPAFGGGVQDIYKLPTCRFTFDCEHKTSLTRLGTVLFSESDMSSLFLLRSRTG